MLAGVGGTFARWFDEEIFAGGPLNSGTLALSEVAPGTVSEATLGVLTPEQFGTYEMVPGDVLTFSFTVTPTIVGDNMVATLTTTENAATGPLAEFVVFDIVIVGGDGTGLTEADSGTPIQAQVTATLPFTVGGEPGAGNGTDGQSATLQAGDIDVTLVQNDR